MKGIWTHIYPSVTLQTKKLAKKQVLSFILHPPSYLHQISCLLWLHLALIQRSVTRSNELTPHGAAWKCQCQLVGFWWWKTRMVREESGGVFYLLSCLVVYSNRYVIFSDYSWRNIEMLFSMCLCFMLYVGSRWEFRCSKLVFLFLDVHCKSSRRFSSLTNECPSLKGDWNDATRLAPTIVISGVN